MSIAKNNNPMTSQEDAQAEEVVARQWHEGAPQKPWSEEWFIAVTIYGDRVALRALPEEYDYDFRTADDTYIKADKIKRWMQFPDSAYIAPPAPDDVVRAAIEAERKACAKIYPPTSETFPYQAAGYASGWHDGIAAYRKAISARKGGGV